MLTDDAKNPRQKPTKENILDAMVLFVLRIIAFDFRLRPFDSDGWYRMLSPMIRCSSTVSLALIIRNLP